MESKFFYWASESLLHKYFIFTNFNSTAREEIHLETLAQPLYIPQMNLNKPQYFMILMPTMGSGWPDREMILLIESLWAYKTLTLDLNCVCHAEHITC